MRITAAELFDDSDEEVKPTMGKRKARGEDTQHKKSAEKTQAEKKPKTNSAPVEEQPERPVTLSVSRRGYTDGFADPQKNYEGHYKSPYVSAPTAAKVTGQKGLPVRQKDKTFLFPGHSEFRPNLSPSEVMKRGSFGGTYWRPIYSRPAGKQYSKAHLEFPEDWWAGLSKRQMSSASYDASINSFKKPCGGSLDMWQSSGWINPIDPYGWFQWYCRFFLGRRTTDDRRQIDRWLKSAGPKGRFRNQLIGKVVNARTTYDDPEVSPVIRQTLQHWGYLLTEDDFNRYCKLKNLK